MSETSERFRRVAADFTRRVDGVSTSDWDRPSPCEGWSARDVVTHVVSNASTFLALAGYNARLADAHDDPSGMWAVARDALQAALENDEIAGREFDGPMGRSTLEQTIATFGLGDVLIHTWDLAVAAGLDERLDAHEVERLLQAMKPRDEALRQAGRFGPRIDAPEDADTQTQLLLFTGRRTVLYEP